MDTNENDDKPEIIQIKSVEAIGDGVVTGDDLEEAEAQVSTSSQELKISSTKYSTETVHELENEELELVVSDDSNSVSELSTDSDFDKFADFESSRGKEQKTTNPEDFLEQIRILPNIDEISLSSIAEREEVSEASEPDLTEMVVEEQTQFEGVTDESTHGELESDISEFDYKFEESSIEETVVAKPSIKMDENMLDAFLGIFDEPQDVQIKIVFEDYEHMHMLKKLKKDVDNFLNALFEAVVEVVEHVDPHVVLRKNLDKLQMFRWLIIQLGAVQRERRINKFLKSKCLLHFRRAKATRQYEPDKPEKLTSLIENYKQTLNELDHLLGRQKIEDEKINAQLEQAQAQAAVEEIKTKVEIEKLEDLMRHTFSERRGIVLRKMVEQAIGEMAKLRAKLCTKRQTMIEHQHSKALLIEKTEKLQKVTSTLRLDDYERNMGKIKVLHYKIEEQEARLIRTRWRLNMLKHDLAHIKGRQTILYETLESKLQKFSKAEEEKQSKRAYIHRLKLMNLSLKKQIIVKSNECGLIDKPALLFHYDQTLEQCQQLQGTIKNLKTEFDMLEHKIATVLMKGL